MHLPETGSQTESYFGSASCTGPIPKRLIRYTIPFWYCCFGSGSGTGTCTV